MRIHSAPTIRNTVAAAAMALILATAAGTSITVETLNGTVMLSGFAKSAAEKAAAEITVRA